MLRRLAVAVGVSSAIVVGSPAHAQLRLGGEFQVGSGTADLYPELIPAVSSSPDGHFVIVWSSFRPGGIEVHGERFAPAGAPAGGEFQVSSYTSAYDFFPGVASDAAGNFVVVWSRLGGSYYYAYVMGQRFNAQGGKIGAEFQVNQTTAYGYFSRPSVASDPVGNFVVSWTNVDPSAFGAAARRFDASGTPLGPEFQVNTYTTGPQGLPGVAMDAVGNFVVTWTQDEGGYENVVGQRFDATGTRTGAEFQVNSFTTSGYNAYSQIAMKGDGGFVVVWNNRVAPNAVDIRGRLFGSTGAALGPDFLVSSFTTGNSVQATVAMDDSGRFFVVWRDPAGLDGASGGIFGHEFTPTGVSVGSDFQVNTFTTGDQSFPVASTSPAGKFVVTWANFSNGTSVFQQLGFALERTHLRYGVVRNGATLTSVTPPQNVMITDGGAWTAVSDRPYVTVTPSGSGSGFLNIQVVNGAGLPTTGAAPQATITVSSADLPGLPQTILVDVQVYAPGTTTVPFGFFDAPISGLTGVTGAIAVTGWVLDDIGVTGVQIWRDVVAGDPPPAPNGKIFVGDATFVSEARPDVDAVHPTFPLSYRAAWGYMLLTNMLPNVNTLAPVGGVGTFTLYAYAYDVEGNATVLPAHTIGVDNTTATKPFGTVDTPGPGAVVSGPLDNFGWVLTPQTATIPIDGSTIRVFVDGIERGAAAYNAPRADIAALFPGYNNSGGPVGVFTVDTATLANGVHTIFWIVTDDQARADGIGSRFFTVLN